MKALVRKLMRDATVSVISTGVSMCVLGTLVVATAVAFGSLWVVQFVVLDRVLFRSRHRSASGAAVLATGGVLDGSVSTGGRSADGDPDRDRVLVAA